MPHVIYVSVGFPPAAKSSAYRMKQTANLLVERGCDVTVVTVQDEAWLREFGLDLTLMEGVSPKIEYAKIPVSREDINPDITTYSWWRARHPTWWLKRYRRVDQRHFPEPVFGRWRKHLENAVLDIHARKPADLVLVTSAPYTALASGWRLWKEHRVPFAIDYRDGWSIDVIEGDTAFSRRSRRGRWETRLVKNAQRVWCVNEPIRSFYAERYPEAAERFKIVRNGADEMPDFTPRPVDPKRAITFGYLGTMNFPLAYLHALLEGWQEARESDPLLAESTLEIRGRIGQLGSGTANSYRRTMARFDKSGVSYGGPVDKADVGRVYSQWDALVLALTGGPFVTSGKVFEYVATGLPVISVHTTDHGALEVLKDHPLWVPPPPEITAETMAKSFSTAAAMVRNADDDSRRQMGAYAARFERRAQMTEAIDDLLSCIAVDVHDARKVSSQ